MSSTSIQNSMIITKCLPDSIISLVFEFLPLSDYPSVSLSHKTFYNLVKQHYPQWAKHIFAKFLDDEIFYCLDSLPLMPSISTKRSTYLYEDKTEPKHILKNYVTIQDDWNTVLGLYFNDHQKEKLITEVFTVLRCPPIPFPRLKRDTQCFTTNSLFQNFLTEAYFRLNRKCFSKERRHMLIEDLVNKMQSVETSGEACEDDLLALDTFLSGCEEGKTLEIRQTNVAKLYELIYLMAQNHCQMIRSYMSSISEPADFLEQYTKFWNNYVMIVIDLDEIFTSLSNCLNNKYHEKFESADFESDKFATWRVLIKIWTSEVFNKLSDCLGDIVNTLVGDLRKAKDGEEEEKERVMDLIQATYHAISDLSYDEYNIFFWECEPTHYETPKGVIDAKILNNINAVYHQTEVIHKSNTMMLTSQFTEDKKLFKQLFGKELAHNVTGLHASFFQGYLQDAIYSACPKAETTISTSKNKRASLFNFHKIVALLDLENEHEVKISRDTCLQGRLEEVLLGHFPWFDGYLNLLNDFGRKFLTQRNKISDKKLTLLKKGFGGVIVESRQGSFLSGKKSEVLVMG